MTLREKLLNIQNKLKAPKNQYNDFGRYSYRNCEDILEAVKPLCLEQGAVLKIDDEIIQIGDRYYIKATATLFDCASDELARSTAYAREEENKKGMDSAQLTGATSSYARKYALNGLFAIDDSKDADSMNNTPQEKPTPAKSKPTSEPITAEDIFQTIKSAEDLQKADEQVRRMIKDMPSHASKIGTYAKALGVNDLDAIKSIVMKYAPSGKTSDLSDVSYLSTLSEIKELAMARFKQ